MATTTIYTCDTIIHNDATIIYTCDTIIHNDATTICTCDTIIHNGNNRHLHWRNIRMQ